jgi:hypothetical protein
MYVWIWRKLPGNLAAKLAESLALLAGVVAVLLFVVFPYVEPRLPFNNVNVDQPATTDNPVVQPSGATTSPTSTVIIHPSTTPHA